MHDLTCLIKGCQARVYAPAGTHSICREHFLTYLIWRRRKGPQMFMKYAGMTMEERDPLVAEWANTIRVEEAPTASAPKTYRPHASHKKTVPATVFLRAGIHPVPARTTEEFARKVALYLATRVAMILHIINRA